MESRPLVSIGIPTYNRPEGLRKTLENIVSQSYKNVEIIISDNCSTKAEVRIVLNEFKAKDSRIIIYEQPKNIGPAKNFGFVLDKARGDYYMWAADDDEWQGAEFLSALMEYASGHVLTFPEAVIKNENNVEQRLLGSFKDCISQMDYSKNFIICGWGYPFYGLYNLKLFKTHNLNFDFDEDLAYHNEGTFLHKIFLTGSVKYVSEVEILFSTNSIKPPWEQRVDSYVGYLKRTIVLYNNSSLPSEKKIELVNLVIRVYLDYLKALLISILPTERSSKKRIEERSFIQKAFKRIRKSARVLIKGY
jgi:glycosyltransferase involved in cell wall biosynthesis